MKFNTEITTRNWNNGWVDVNVRMPSKDTECFILWQARLISYDPKTMKSTHVGKDNGMGYCDFIDGKWQYQSIESNTDTEPFSDSFDWYVKYPLANHDYDSGTISCYEIIDSDVFESNPNRVYVLSRDNSCKPISVHSMEIEVLAWCSIPDDPINPFEKENANE